jgi:putative component of toxin-antitoxin plasmid stabilization module
VLARPHGGRGDLDVRGWDREVHDDLHVRVIQRELGGAVLGDPVLLGPGLRGLREEVGDDAHFHVRERGEVVQILLGDDACADDGDAHRSTAHFAAPDVASADDGAPASR